MDFEQQKQQRINFLKAIYQKAVEFSPTSPTSIMFGLSNRAKLVDGKVVKDEVSESGYLIGESIGLDRNTVKSIVAYCSSKEEGLLGSSLGMQKFYLTTYCIQYLEGLEEEITPLINMINISDSSQIQVQQNSNNSQQTLNIQVQNENINEFFELLRSEISKGSFQTEIGEELTAEIEYAERQIKKGNQPKEQLKNIGNLLKNVRTNVVANLIASPIFEVMKPLLGM